MNCPALHVPLEFEHREDLRKLAKSLPEDQRPRVVAFWLRLWAAWGRAGTEWRALDQAVPDWTKEECTPLLEESVGWTGEPGVFLDLCLKAGVLRVEARGDLSGLVLSDFWRWNEHLRPDYKNFHEKGGHARAARQREADMMRAADQQHRLLQPQLLFPAEQKPSAEEEKRAVFLVMRMDRACGQPVRPTSDYSPGLLAAALDVIRRFGKDNVDLVERYLTRNRENPSVIKNPDRVIERFEEYAKCVE